MPSSVDPGLWEKLWTVLAMVVGALVPMAFKSGLTPREMLLNVGVGVAGAAFVSPALMEWLAMKSPQMEAAAAFAVGLVSWHACEWASRNAPRLLDQLSKRFTGGGS